MGIFIPVRGACYRPSFAWKVKTFARASETEKKPFPSEYSFAICLISLAFLTELCAKGDKKKTPLSRLFSMPFAYLPNFRIFMQSDTANNSGHLGVPFYFLHHTNNYFIFFLLPRITF